MGVEVETTFPPLFAREEGKSDNVKRTEDFFTKEEGSIAMSEEAATTALQTAKLDFWLG